MKIRLAAVLLLAAATSLRADDLASRINSLAKKYDVTVGVSAEDTITGKRVAVRADEAFPMGSVYKFPIVLAILHKNPNSDALDREITIEPAEFAPGHSPLRDAAGTEPIRQPLGALIVAALRDSDNTASDAVLREVGGPAGVMSYLNFLGARGIDVSRSEKEIAADIGAKGEAAYWSDPRDSATPYAMMVLFRMFNEKAHGLNAGTQQFVQAMLAHSVTGQHRIRAGVAADANVIDKTGTMPGVVNDAGIATSSDDRHRVVMTIFTKGWKKSVPDADREKLIADIARLIWDEFTTYPAAG